MNDDDYHVYRKWMSLWWIFGKTNICMSSRPIARNPSHSVINTSISERNMHPALRGVPAKDFLSIETKPLPNVSRCFLSVSNAWHLYRCGVKLLNANGVDTPRPMPRHREYLQRECLLSKL
ncbi:hypothetical protein JTE90_008253 [Oedothorax gibbosus]|uniref:Uncharacterized protein n=1 Tax=Oedothorax gibbosus TaxID=931172 RepID=A0AAV6TNT3_9ARAC|nr:hypothetical protein JTE90_008253 [Oedothorax gibbosus]